MFNRSKENLEKSKKINYILYLIAHKGSGFDSYIVVNNLPQWRTNVNLIKNGVGIVSVKVFNGYIDQTEKILNMFF